MVRQWLLPVLATALLFGSVRCDDAAEGEESTSDVLVATDANWKEVVEDKDLILVEFYAPWCGHCKMLAPKYEEAAKILKEHDPPIHLAKMDATVEKKYASEAGVQGYPTLKIYRQGVMSDYNGPRETEGIVEYMKKQVGPSSKELKDSKEVKSTLNKKTLDHEAIVGYFSSTDSLDFKVFMQVANHFRDKFAFYHVANPSTLEALGYYSSGSAIFAYRPWGGKHFKALYDGLVMKQPLISWILDNALPPVGYADKDKMEVYSQKGKPQLRAFIPTEGIKEHEKALKDVLSPIQKKFEKKLTFVINDAGHEEYGFDESDLKDRKAFVIEDGRKRFRWTEDQGSVDEWVDKWSKKQATKWVKSEKAAPKAEPGEVQVVVGSTFEDIVMDPTKDVLIEFYAPWCGHCKALEPKYTDLAKEFKDSPNVVIAKMDATANENTHKKYQAKGFPTILFAPSNKKDNPIPYEGSREVEDMAKWVREHATV